MTTVIEHVNYAFDDLTPHTLETLHALLERYTLDPTFERYGDFVTQASAHLVALHNEKHGSGLDPERTYHVWGNFFDFSGVFSVYTDDEKVLEELLAAIKRNKSTPAYKEARDTRKEQVRQKLAHERVMRERLKR